MLTRRIALVALLAGAVLAGAGRADDKKDDKKDEKRGGTIVGVVSAKDKAWIEVKADGEDKARRYVPHWKGGLPKDGGGPDPKMVEEIGKVAVGSRVQIMWEFEERPRVTKIEVLKAPEKKEEKKEK